jgi:hypothetical protein
MVLQEWWLGCCQRWWLLCLSSDQASRPEVMACYEAALAAICCDLRVQPVSACLLSAVPASWIIKLPAGRCCTV